VIGWGDVHNRRATCIARSWKGWLRAAAKGPNAPQSAGGWRITERVAGRLQSEAAMQLTADIFGLPVCARICIEASGLGAAIDAAVG